MPELKINDVVQWTGATCPRSKFTIIRIIGEVVLLRYGTNPDSRRKAYHRANIKDVRGLFVDIEA